jgi:chaperonin GroEL
MVGRKLFFGDHQRKLLLEGIRELGNAVGSTLGPKGKTVLIHKSVHPIITKDGVSVAREIYFTNNIKNAGVQVIKDAAISTNIAAGDGTTTSTVLAHHMIEKGFYLIDRGYNPNDLKRGMAAAKKAFLEELPSYGTKIANEENIRSIARISSNSDEEIASAVTEAFEGIGDYGIVDILDSFNSKTSVSFSAGTEIERGIISSYFINRKDNSCELDNPKILLCQKPVNNYNSLMSLLQWASNTQESLIIIAPEFDESVVSMFVQNVGKKILKGCLIKVPGWNRQTIEDSIEDLAILLNVKSIAFKDTDDFDSSKYPAGLGSCVHFKGYANKSIFSGVNPDEEELKKHTENLTSTLSEWEKKEDPSMNQSSSEIERMRKRVARLIGGVATIYVGGDTSVELIEKKHRFEDAVNAVKAALDEGVVPGGGITYLNLSDYLNKQEVSEDIGFKEGWNLIVEVLKEPFKKICENGGRNSEIISVFIQQKKEEILGTVVSSEAKLETTTLKFVGYDAGKGKVVDNMLDAGIIDPLKVTRMAFINAYSVASTLLTTDCSIVDENENLGVIPNDAIMDEYNYSQGEE